MNSHNVHIKKSPVKTTTLVTSDKIIAQNKCTTTTFITHTQMHTYILASMLCSWESNAAVGEGNENKRSKKKAQPWSVRLFACKCISSQKHCWVQTTLMLADKQVVGFFLVWDYTCPCRRKQLQWLISLNWYFGRTDTKNIFNYSIKLLERVQGWQQRRLGSFWKTTSVF